MSRMIKRRGINRRGIAGVRAKRLTPYISKGVIKMEMAIKREDEELNVMSNIRRIAQKAIKDKRLTEEQIRKSLGIKRYEK